MKAVLAAFLLAAATQATACPPAAEVDRWKTKIVHTEGNYRDVAFSPPARKMLGLDPLLVYGRERLVGGKWLLGKVNFVLPGRDPMPHYGAFLAAFAPLADGKLPDPVCGQSAEDTACILHPRGRYAPGKAGDLVMIDLARREPGVIRPWRKAARAELQLICDYDTQPG